MTRYLVACPPDETTREVLALGRQLSVAAYVHHDVVTVAPGPWAFRSKASVDAEYVAFVEQRAAGVLERARKELGDVPAEYTVLHEHRSVATTLISRAEATAAEMVLIGSSRRRPGRISVGSTADALLHRSGVPVATAPEGYSPPPGTALSRVTVGVSGSKGEQDAMSLAARLVRERGIPLRVATTLVVDRDAALPVVGFGPDMAIWTEWHAELRTLHAELLEGLPPDVQGTSIITQGDSWAAAIDALDPLDGEMMIIGCSGQGLMRHVFLGTHSGKIVRNAGLPVVVVPPAAQH
ncbi:MAG TPA: universal stress protein [Jiangellales bacterium]|nr:universal stress protein [Jiangellales bacterium]